MRNLWKSAILATAMYACCACQERPPLELAAKELTGSDRQAYYRAIVTEFAGEPSDDDIWVIGLRGVSANGKRHDSRLSSGGYDDTLVVLQSGNKGVMEFQAATHAGSPTSSDAPWGVAQIRPGCYRAAPLRGRGTEPVWQLLTQEGEDGLPAWRDRDGNGWVSQDERELDEHYGTKANNMVLGNGADAKRPTSSGGPTLAPAEFERFVHAVGPRREFHYLLIDANNPVVEESRDLRLLASPLSPLDDFRFYERIALGKGVDPSFSLLVIGLRGLSPDGQRHESDENVGDYNDTFLVLRRGSGSVRPFLGSLHAGQASTTRSPGVYAGIAQVRPGLYFCRFNDIYHGLWSWHIVQHESDFSGRIPAWRDKDKDGFLSSHEKRAAESNGTYATEILIHNGLDPDVGNSIGCFTMPPQILEQFIEEVGSEDFPILLLDANNPHNF